MGEFSRPKEEATEPKEARSSMNWLDWHFPRSPSLCDGGADVPTWIGCPSQCSKAQVGTQDLRIQPFQPWCRTLLSPISGSMEMQELQALPHGEPLYDPCAKRPAVQYIAGKEAGTDRKAEDSGFCPAPLSMRCTRLLRTAFSVCRGVGNPDPQESPVPVDSAQEVNSEERTIWDGRRTMRAALDRPSRTLSCIWRST